MNTIGQRRFTEVYGQLIDSILDRDFCGYDPYDGINTRTPGVNSCTGSRLFFTYLNKFSPVNLRPILRVRKSRQLMTMCLTGNAIMMHAGGTRRSDEFDRTLHEIWADMKRRSLRNVYGYHCWDAHDFPIQMIGRYTIKDTVSVVGNQIFGEFLVRYYRQFGNEEVLEYIREIRDFFVNAFLVETPENCFFKYKPQHGSNQITFNASLKAASFLMQAGDLLNCSRYDELLEKVFSTVVKWQKEDGRWNYMRRLDEEVEKPQVDFHQGFILDDLLDYMQYSGRRGEFERAYLKGLGFYRDRQFLPDGRGVYRYPRSWPANIQNQAQGILTFTRAASINPVYLDLARRVAEWTLRNMYDGAGRFYYLKYRIFTNGVSYIRWSDSGMAYALAVFLSTPEEAPRRRPIRGVGASGPRPDEAPPQPRQ
jgi:hypothetical protein